MKTGSYMLMDFKGAEHQRETRFQKRDIVQFMVVSGLRLLELTL